MWRLGFFFHEMAFGLLSIFLPLYVIAIGGTLVHVGLMSSFALFLVIPASFFWGYACDKSKRYKRYILISFLASAIILCLFTLTTSLDLLILLYAVMAILHVAHEPPKNVLIAELYSRNEWERAFAFYEGFTETGWLIGLLLGFLMSTFGLSATSTLLLCSGLNLVALITSLILVTDPLLVFERSLVNIERTIDFTLRGTTVASKILDGLSPNEKMKKENLFAFASGLVLFSIATSMLFTPLPVFFSQELALPTSVVFALFVLNSGGGVAGYFLVGGRSHSGDNFSISRLVILRSVLAFLLLSLIQKPAFSTVLAAAILILMGFVYAIFLVYMLSFSMELIPAGKAGLFNVLLGIGGASGSFLGPFIAQVLGFTYIFLAAGLIFFLASMAFKIFK